MVKTPPENNDFMKTKLLFVLLITINTISFSQTYNHHGGIYAVSENLIYIMADEGRFYKSDNGGLSWDEYNSGINVDFYDLNFSDENMGLAIGASGTILKTDNGGQSWTEIPSGTTQDLYSIAGVSNNNTFIVGHAGTVLHSTDGGDSWNMVTGISTERLNYIDFKNSNIGYIAGDNGMLLYTEDAGSTWTPLDVGTTDHLYIVSVTENSVALLSGPGRDYSYREGLQAITSIDNINWVFNSLNDIGGVPAPISGFYFQNNNTGYAVHSADMLCECCRIEILKTTDEGSLWDSIYNEEFEQYGCNAHAGFSDISFFNEQKGYVLIGNKVLTITPDDVVTNYILSTEDVEKEPLFTLLPNPAENEINIQLKNLNPENLHLDILDSNGRTVFSENTINNNSMIDVSSLSSGLYFVSLKQNEKTIGLQKLIKN